MVAFCDKLAAAGMIVRCDVTEAIYKDLVDEDSVSLQCPRVPANAGAILSQIIGIYLVAYDLRDGPSQDCGDFELDLTLLGDM